MNRKKNIIIFAALYCIASIFCNRQKLNSNWKGGAITSFGEFIYLDSQIILSVHEVDGILKYKASSKKGGTFESLERPNIYQTWLLYYDTATDEIWVQSSDIGIFNWKYNALDKKYIETEITSNTDDIIRRIPFNFFNLLPNSDKEFCLKNGYKIY